MSKLTKDERADLVREAQEKLVEAIDLLKQSEPTPYVEAYLIAHLEIFAGEGHGYVTGDTNLDEVIENILNGEDDEAEEDDAGDEDTDDD